MPSSVIVVPSGSTSSNVERENVWFQDLAGSPGERERAFAAVREGAVDPRIAVSMTKNNGGETALHILARVTCRDRMPLERWHEVLTWGIGIDALNGRWTSALDGVVMGVSNDSDLEYIRPIVSLLREHGAAFTANERLPYRYPLPVLMTQCSVGDMRRWWNGLWQPEEREQEWPWLWWGMCRSFRRTEALEWAWEQRPEGGDPNVLPSDHLNVWTAPAGEKGPPSGWMRPLHNWDRVPPLWHLFDVQNMERFDRFKASLRPDGSTLLRIVQDQLASSSRRLHRQKYVEEMLERGASLDERAYCMVKNVTLTCRDYIADAGETSGQGAWLAHLDALQRNVQRRTLIAASDTVAPSCARRPPSVRL